MYRVLQRSVCLVVVVILLDADGEASRTPVSLARTVSFNRDIRPILSANCWQCHGSDASARQAKLRLDIRAESISHQASGQRVLVPGNSAASLLLSKVSALDPADRMPPPETGKQLTNDQIELLRQWIDEGAAYEVHWSFIAPDRPAVPVTPLPQWGHNEIDAFVLRGLSEEELSPAPRTDPEVLLRRVTFDLTGLGPTLDEIDAFMGHELPSRAYEEAVDRLLDSPRFGERMAVPWLDVARYADSYGYQSDQLSPTWPYRDWVVGAFNRNLPFDEFIRWQIAGDLLPNATRQQRLATAFNRLHRMTNEGGSVEEEWRIEYVADRVQTFGTAFLGLTLQCARCHDHKFDPITTREYYGLTAFFNSIDEWGMYHDSSRIPTPSLLLPTQEQENQLAALEGDLEHAESILPTVAKAQESAFVEWLRDAPEQEPILPGLVGHYPLDALGPEHKLENLADRSNPGSTAPANVLVKGVSGSALRFTGDDGASFPKVAGALNPWDTFSVAFWLRVPEGVPDGVVFHRSGGTDVGRFGTELSLKTGRLFFGMIRFWPGNAIAIEADESLATNQWTHVAVTYDGSGRADGMHLYIDGDPAESNIVRDALTKSPGAGGTGITFGERFRGRGLTGGAIDDLHVFDRAIAPIEVAQLYDGVALTRELAAREMGSLRLYYMAGLDVAMTAARDARSEALHALLDFRSGITETMVMEEASAPRMTYVLHRGAYDAAKSQANIVMRSTPASLPPMPEGAASDRLGLAQWTTAKENPLTARVIVNRLWQMFFGRGLVFSSEDFGAQGTFPDAPDLLDWLAVEFVDSGWDVKQLCHLIVTSATYQQASTFHDDLVTRDPNNTLLARGPSRRLSAEMLRDLALAASGLLDETMGGPPVSPYQPPGLWRESNTMSPAYRQSVGSALYRRSLYTVWKRTTPMPNMMALDAATREVCIARREATNSPIQALVLLNDPQFVEAARVMGERMVREGGETDADRATFAFRLFTGRRPEVRELELLLELYRRQRDLFTAEPDRAGNY